MQLTQTSLASCFLLSTSFWCWPVMVGRVCVRLWCGDEDLVGVWDVMANEEVLEFVRKRIAQRMKPAQVQ